MITFIGDRMPPDKYTASNISINCHREEIQYHHHIKGPLDKSTVMNYTVYGIHIQQNICGYHDITT